jgi:hypothetical protein
MVVELTQAATAKAARRAGDVIAPVLPAGTDPEALLRGTADLTPAELAPPPAPVVDDSFEHVQWLDGGTHR